MTFVKAVPTGSSDKHRFKKVERSAPSSAAEASAARVLLQTRTLRPDFQSRRVVFAKNFRNLRGCNHLEGTILTLELLCVGP